MVDARALDADILCQLSEAQSAIAAILLVAKWLDEATILRLGAMPERRGSLGDRRPII
jgi:hypothetical protein